MTDPAELQRQYYTASAARYDAEHVRQADEHAVALQYATGLMATLNLRSVLDVGCGTGRGITAFLERGLDAHGIDPVEALLEQGVTDRGIARSRLTCGSGDNLPYSDAAFDAVWESGVLHHVRHPLAVVREMTRVARRAVFLSDSNRFGQGRLTARCAKLAVSALGLHRAVELIRTRGRGYHWSEGDGLFYSFSVYDVIGHLHQWADRVFVIPTMPGGAQRGWLSPLLTEPHLLVCAIRDGTGTQVTAR